MNCIICQVHTITDRDITTQLKHALSHTIEHLMESHQFNTAGCPPEVTSLDDRIAQAGGTSSRIELQPHRLRQSKEQPFTSLSAQRDELLRGNGHFRQEIIFYQEYRNAMLEFHGGVLEVYHGLHRALRELSEKQALAEGRIERYWGIPLTVTREKDVTVL